MAINNSPISTIPSPSIFNIDKKAPIRLALASLLFIYVLQYPLSRLLRTDNPTPLYTLTEWMAAYVFVTLSTVILLLTMIAGLSGRPVQIQPSTTRIFRTRNRLGLTWVLILFIAFGLWSYLMVKLNIGMTIWTDFEALPFRITGILFYGRLFLQPLILTYIAVDYANSKLKWVIYLLIVGLGAWVSLSSGSRFAGIAFALPLLFLFKGKLKYLAFGFPLLVFIVIATASRNFYLPMIIGDINLMQIYANEDYQSSTIDNLWMLPILYFIIRSMGISEVLLTLSFGNITPDFISALAAFVAYFLPFLSTGPTVSIKNIYGLDDDAFGGFGLDLFSNFYVMFGGELPLYFIGLGLMGWLLGKTYRMFAIGLARFRLHGFSFLIFIILFILIFEGRGHLFPALLTVGWLLSRKNARKYILLGFEAFSLRNQPLTSKSN